MQERKQQGCMAVAVVGQLLVQKEQLIQCLKGGE